MNSDKSEMRKLALDATEFDELWLLHEELTKILAEKISAEKQKLEKRLAQLSRAVWRGTESPKRTEDRSAKAQISESSAEIL